MDHQNPSTPHTSNPTPHKQGITGRTRMALTKNKTESTAPHQTLTKTGTLLSSQRTHPPTGRHPRTHRRINYPSLRSNTTLANPQPGIHPGVTPRTPGTEPPQRAEPPHNHNPATRLLHQSNPTRNHQHTGGQTPDPSESTIQPQPDIHNNNNTEKTSPQPPRENPGTRRRTSNQLFGKTASTLPATPADRIRPPAPGPPRSPFRADNE
ncbi:hypothetical protein FHX42_002407 [Saccharopolyspora lacisalsi]|uniref:Uncharacterized protein n=1 Tax=Halosaccharopolyspora lacisalsi TaxID=1000566 RepID=A0A839DXV5_9PSEU|nr:hypothetical protein [Halosaccharopolyspora lacisalsi]